MTDIEPADAGHIRTAARLVGVELTDEQASQIANNVARNAQSYEGLRSVEVANGEPSALRFEASRPPLGPAPAAWDGSYQAKKPGDLHWADVATLGALLRSGETSSVELTELALARLEKLDPVLRCVVTLTPERALDQARERDAEAGRGAWRGPLHGIPWGAKDLLAVRGYPTQWGSGAHRGQTIDDDAAVVRRLDAAGAVLVAKLSLGELAMGDQWFAARTNNPWNPEQGSSGSSAGSASAVAAGCVPFAIGSETLGSILSPSAVCGCSSLRPTYGAVDATGAMTLAASMDKLGPMCRSVFDAAIVFAAVGAGACRVPAQASSLHGVRVGVLRRTFEKAPEAGTVVGDLEALGAELVDIELPEAPVQAMRIILSAEAAEAFDELTRSGRDAQLVGQGEYGWPASFRASRLIPAVEYLRANRVRARVMAQMDAALAGVDCYVHPALTGYNLTLTNLTGHPSVVAPCGPGADGMPRAVAFTGRPYDDARVLMVADAWQRSTSHHLARPPAAT